MLNRNQNIPKINIIESSCLTPPESFFNSYWLRSIKINELDNLIENNDNYNNSINYSNNFDENLIFEIEV